MTIRGRLKGNKLGIIELEFGPFSMALILFTLFAAVLFISPSVGEPDINISKTVVPGEILPCENATIWINVTATGEPYEVPQPICVMLVLDMSSSMSGEYNDKTTVEYIKQAAKVFIGNVNFSQDSVGIVSYGNTAQLLQPLINNPATLNATIDGLDDTPGSQFNPYYTNMGEGIRRAQVELQNCVEGSVPIMILFTDGVPTAYGDPRITCNACPTSDTTCTLYARNWAEWAKNNGTTIFTVGYFNGFCGSAWYQCDPPCTQTINLAKDILTDAASKPEYFFEAPTPEDLEGIYANVSKVINDIAASNIKIMDYLALGIINQDGTGDPVQFTISTISINESWNNSINITSNMTGDYLPTNENISYIQYTLPNGTQVTQNLTTPEAVPKIYVLDSDFEINKTAEYYGYPDPAIPGAQINYTIWINNTGNVNLTNPIIIDSLYSVYLPGNKTGDDQGPGVLNVSERWKYVFNVTLSPNPGPWINNTVTANFTDPCGYHVNRSDWANISTACCISGMKTVPEGESPAGFVIQVRNLTTGQVVATNETNETGYWKICGLAPGNYNVTEQPKPGWSLNTQVYDISIPRDCGKDTFVFDNVPCCISGTKRVPANRSAAGFEIELKDSNGTVVANATTDSNGSWSICDLVSGNYTLIERPRPGWTPNDQFYNVTIPLDCGKDTFVFDNVPCCISGTKRVPANSSAAGFEIELKDSNGTVVANATTDVNGSWSICDLVDGSYTVSETPKSGWANNTQEYNISIPDDCGNMSLNFENLPLFCISGHKYWDKNGDGVRDLIEDQPLKNWTVQVRNESGWLVANATTDDNGYWEVCNLVAGEYNISEVVEAGWKPTDPPGGHYDPFAINDNVTNLDFLNTGIFCISGYKYWDKDGDGVIDPEDDPIGDWVIFIDEDGDRRADPREPVTTAGGDGFWEICNLPPGTYVVCEELICGWTQTYPKGSGRSDCHSVHISNQSVAGLDFLNYRPHNQLLNEDSIQLGDQLALAWDMSYKDGLAKNEIDIDKSQTQTAKGCRSGTDLINRENISVDDQSADSTGPGTSSNDIRIVTSQS